MGDGEAEDSLNKAMVESGERDKYGLRCHKIQPFPTIFVTA